MTDAVTIALIVVSGQIVTAGLTLVGIALSQRNGKKLDDLHRVTNGMQSALIASASREGVTRGIAQEKAAEKLRVDASLSTLRP